MLPRDKRKNRKEEERTGKKREKMKKKEMTKDELINKLRERDLEIIKYQEQYNQLNNNMYDIKRAERAEGYREAIEAILEILKGDKND